MPKTATPFKTKNFIIDALDPCSKIIKKCNERASFSAKSCAVSSSLLPHTLKDFAAVLAMVRKNFLFTPRQAILHRAVR